MKMTGQSGPAQAKDAFALFSEEAKNFVVRTGSFVVR